MMKKGSSLKKRAIKRTIGISGAALERYQIATGAVGRRALNLKLPENVHGRTKK